MAAVSEEAPGQDLTEPEGRTFDPDALRRKYREERDKRLRADANEQYVEMAGQFAHYLEDPYVDPGFSREPRTDEVDVASSAADSEACSQGPACGRLAWRAS